jgi:outer membrane protein assembly factor BamB
MSTTLARFGLGTIAAALLTATAQTAHAQWPQWGGPNRDFKAETQGLADTWPEEGPKRLWRHELGDGCSGITVDEGRLYTMYRSDQFEYTIALDAKTGKTIWEHKYPSPYDPNSQADQYCSGPNSTPLICGDRLFSIGTDSVIHGFDKKTGKVLWRHDFHSEFGGCEFPWGYAGSPLAYKNLVIAPVGKFRPREAATTQPQEKREAPALVAFDQATGKIAWKTRSIHVDHSSPILIRFLGEDQVILVLSKGIIGLNPTSGEELWRHALAEEYGHDMTPVWVNGDTLVTSTGRHAEAIKLKRVNGKTVPEPLWKTPKARYPQNNPVEIDGCLYGSSGAVNQRSVVLAMEADTGKRLWAKRGLGLATCVFGGGKLIFLDENGTLALTTVTREGFTMHSSCRIAQRHSWTVPTLVGTTLYVRDRHHILALDLGDGG